MPRSTRKITKADILSETEYAQRRKDLRAQAIAKKRNRRIEVGPFATLHFESYETMWLQVQEMLRIEKGGAEQIPGELEVYNPLIPQGSELIATLMLEIEDPLRRNMVLGRLGGIEETLSMEIGTDRIGAAPTDYEDRTTPEGKTSSVHWVRFPFTRANIAAFKNGEHRVVVGINHTNYGHMAVMPDEMRRELATDFS